MTVQQAILIFLILLSGWIVQRRGFCLVAAVEGVLNKNPRGLLLILSITLFSGAVLMVINTPMGYSISIIDGKLSVALLGACLFGIGAALNNGCFFGTLTKLCGGNGHMLFSLSGIILASIIIPPLSITDTSLRTPSPSIFLYVFCLIIIVVLWLYHHKHNRLYSFIWLLIPGITFGIVNSSTSGWSLSQLILNIWYYFNENSHFVGMQIIEFLAFFLGMFLYHAWYKKFKIVHIQLWSSMRHFFAGIIMVLGARMMDGGNDSLLFKKLPSLMPEILLLLAIVLMSIVLTVIFLKKLKNITYFES